MIMCLPCPDFGCNMKTNLCKETLCLCSDVERSTTQAAAITSCCLQKKKQRLVLPLVGNTDHDTCFPFVHAIHPLFYCWFECVLAKNLTHCWLSTKSFLCTLDTRVGNRNFLASLILDQIILSMHSFVSTFYQVEPQYDEHTTW